MDFHQLDQLIRKTEMNDVARRQILEGVHGIHEGMNLCLSYFLGITGHYVDDSGRYCAKDMRQQVNPRLSGGAGESTTSG